MIKTIVVFVIVACVYAPAYAQVNLVKNGGLEQYAFCPTGFGQIGFANYWSSIDTNWTYSDSTTYVDGCQAEYCNVCASDSPGWGSGVSIPYGEYYYQWPRSGNGMAQLGMLLDSAFFGIQDYRTVAQGRLSNALSAGRAYCVTFYVSLEHNSWDAIQNIGAYIDNGAIDSTDSANCGVPHTWITPQIMADSIISDTLNWVKIQGSYMATGNERFITISNFSDFAHTTKRRTNFPLSGSGGGQTLYLVDDVSVIASDAIADAGHDTSTTVGDSVWIGTTEQGMPCTWYALGDTTHPIGYGGGVWVRPMATGTYEYMVMLDLCGNVTWDTVKVSVWRDGVASALFPKGGLVMYPNPSIGLLNIVGAEGCSVSVFDVVGTQVYVGELAKAKETIDISGLVKGVYMVEIIDNATGYKVVRKVLKE